MSFVSSNSFPKDELASFITTLHSQTFTTPTQFVNIQFKAPEPVGDYYVGGKSQQLVSPNRLIASVRVGPSRTKSMFDEVGIKIRQKWDEIVERPYGMLDMKNPAVKEERERKNLRFIVFKPMTAAIENGVVVPGAGEEGTWLKDNMDFFREQVEMYDDMEFKELLEEVQTSDDLGVH
ncbi:hypothetical protein N7493_004000 [Penicillium malachiteum]|uniref:Tautomerase cis-CaaD-like domain-containing protein n=1 Tax=Penicillium malachiteum TaxID=1324776 RepID=A0AAD6HQT3_9EURO|nr:hypothetical protein N7493_004000 [Penicillium malachiteum]